MILVFAMTPRSLDLAIFVRINIHTYTHTQTNGLLYLSACARGNEVLSCKTLGVLH